MNGREYAVCRLTAEHPRQCADCLFIYPGVLILQKNSIVPFFEGNLHADVVGFPEPQILRAAYEAHLRIAGGYQLWRAVVRSIVYHHHIGGVFALADASQTSVYPAFEVVRYDDCEYSHVSFFVVRTLFFATERFAGLSASFAR